jgi:phosphoribosylamine---glycine ligase
MMDTTLDILLIGGGAREHALAWKLKESARCGRLYCAPGNAGIAEFAECIAMKGEDVDAVAKFVTENNIGLVVIGPEAPLVAGVADRLSEAGVAVFGPSAAAARLEGSKAFMKEICRKYAIPTANYARFTEIAPALSYIEAQGAPIVVKADGLAAGKGVVVASSVEEAKKAAEEMLSGRSFGEAGREIVIEEFLDGEEISFFAISDGEHVLSLSSAQDHKRAFDGDEGPNTGGMGAYSPARLLTPELKDRIMDEIVHPAIDAMKAEGCPFAGVLFAGLMIVNGAPKLIEFNARFGDPECQVLMMRLQSDLVNVLEAAATGNLHLLSLTWSDDPAICVVMAAKGYPGAVASGTPIRNLDTARAVPNVRIFHAATKDKDGVLIADGGRVLSVCAREKTLADSRDLAYRALSAIDWQDGFYRRDIGWRALDRSA